VLLLSCAVKVGGIVKAASSPASSCERAVLFQRRADVYIKEERTMLPRSFSIDTYGES
jgi:hypothetical protein